jgi:hypothetical protein
MAVERVVTLDTVQYNVRGEVVSRNVVGFPDPVPETGRPSEDNFLPHRFASQRSPLSIGLTDEYEVNRISDQENLWTYWPNSMTLGPLKQSPTWSGPSTFKVNGEGFFYGLGTLWVFGIGGSSNDEPVHYWVGASEAWTNATLNADTSDDVTSVVGMAQRGNTLYALRQAVENSRIADKTTDKTTWVHIGTPNALANSRDRAKFLVYVDEGDLFYLLAYTDGVEKDFDIHSHDFSTADSTDNVQTVQQSDAIPRGLVTYTDPAGTTDLFVSSNRALFWFDISAGTLQKMQSFQDPTGGSTGTMHVGPDGKLYVADGPNIFTFQWVDGSGSFEWKSIGPMTVDDPRISWSGLPTAKRGDVTCITSCFRQPWIIAGIGGNASSNDGWVAVYDYQRGQWFCPYQNGTAQRAITAIVHTTADDGQERLHIMEEQAAGGDQDPEFFENFATNPETVSYKYATTGVLTTSWFDGYSPMFRKGFYTWRERGDDVDADETVVVTFATDGGSHGSAQTINTDDTPVQQVWTDGSSNAVGSDAYNIQSTVTLNRSGTNTLSPKLRSFGYSYLVAALNDDDTSIKEWEFVVDLEATARRNPNLKGPDDVRASLRTTQAKRALVTFVSGPDTNGDSTKVKILAPIEDTYEPSKPNTTSEDPRSGFIRVRVQQIGAV